MTDTLTTARLALVPATAAAARAAAHNDRTRFAALLGAAIPADWPPPILADAQELFARMLEADPGPDGWGLWYVLQRGANLLIGSAGFKGRPAADGRVEIGYSILAPWQGRGYATEAVQALIGWAFADRRVGRVVAETSSDLTPSIRVLEKCGFRRASPAAIGSGAEGRALTFELSRAAWCSTPPAGRGPVAESHAPPEARRAGREGE